MSTKRVAACQLSKVEKMRLLDRIDHLAKFLGAPGDWGYGTVLGDLTVQLLEAQTLVRAAEVRDHE